MKLIRLHLGRYRVIQDLILLFSPEDEAGDRLDDRTYGLDFLVGVNGSGKSTCLRAIGEIFLALEQHRSPAFPFEIEYELSVNGAPARVQFSNMQEGLESDGPQHLSVALTVDGRQQHDWSRYLPPRVLVFTTGSEHEWVTLGRTPDVEADDLSAMDLSITDRFLRELPGYHGESEDEASLPTTDRVRLIRNSQLGLVMLCGWLSDTAGISDEHQGGLAEVLKEAQIKGLAGFSLRLRLHGSQLDRDQRRVLRVLAQHASRHIRQGSERLLVFDLIGQERAIAEGILNEVRSALSLFETLAGLLESVDGSGPILQEVNLFVERIRKTDEATEPDSLPILHLFEWLSDGERSFLGRMALFPLLGETDALILLDEPEVHFNDYWKRQIIYLLDRSLAGKQSHVLIATHSSITLTDVPREDILILARSDAGTTRADNPRIQTFAAEPGDIMVHVFGAPHASGAYGVFHLQGVMNERAGDSNRSLRERLEHELERVAPGYWSYRIRRTLLELEAGQ